MKIPYPVTDPTLSDTLCVNCQQPMREHWNTTFGCPGGGGRWMSPAGDSWWLDAPAENRRTRRDLAERAYKIGLRIETLGNGADEDRFWLVGGMNWATTQPGRTLAEITAQLDGLEREREH